MRTRRWRHLVLLSHEESPRRVSHLCLGHGSGAFVLLRQEEADGHEEFVDADSELLLVLAARGQGEEAAGLDDVLEDVLAGLKEQIRDYYTIGLYYT